MPRKRLPFYRMSIPGFMAGKRKKKDSADILEDYVESLEGLPTNIANLFRASIEGNLMSVKRCIGKNMKYDAISRSRINDFDYLNSKDKFGLTPLHHAAKLGHFKIVEILLHSGASAEFPSQVGKTALHYAVEGGNFEIVVMILQFHPDINAEDNWCLTPLHSACTYGHFEIAKFLCRNGAEINASTSTKKLTPLHYAAQIGNAQIVKFLLKKGADFNAIDSLGWNPLEHARVFGHKEVEKLLIEVSRRIDVDESDQKVRSTDMENHVPTPASSTDYLKNIPPDDLAGQILAITSIKQSQVVDCPQQKEVVEVEDQNEKNVEVQDLLEESMDYDYNSFDPPTSDRPKPEDIIAETSIKIMNSAKNIANDNNPNNVVEKMEATKAEEFEKITVDLSNLLTVRLSAVEEATKVQEKNDQGDSIIRRSRVSLKNDIKENENYIPVSPSYQESKIFSDEKNTKYSHLTSSFESQQPPKIAQTEKVEEMAEIESKVLTDITSGIDNGVTNPIIGDNEKEKMSIIDDFSKEKLEKNHHQICYEIIMEQFERALQKAEAKAKIKAELEKDEKRKELLQKRLDLREEKLKKIKHFQAELGQHRDLGQQICYEIVIEQLEKAQDKALEKDEKRKQLQSKKLDRNALNGNYWTFSPEKAKKRKQVQINLAKEDKMKAGNETEKSEAEAKKKADEEARFKAEIEAKKESEDEERFKSEAQKEAAEEARKKAEAEAKKKSDLEAKRIQIAAKKIAYAQENRLIAEKKAKNSEAKKKAEDPKAKTKAEREERRKQLREKLDLIEMKIAKKAEKDKKQKKAEEKAKKKAEEQAKTKVEREQKRKQLHDIIDVKKAEKAAKKAENGTETMADSSSGIGTKLKKPSDYQDFEFKKPAPPKSKKPGLKPRSSGSTRVPITTISNDDDLDKIENRKQLHRKRIAFGEEVLERIKQEKAKRKAEKKAKEKTEKEESKKKAEKLLPETFKTRMNLLSFSGTLGEEEVEKMQKYEIKQAEKAKKKTEKESKIMADSDGSDYVPKSEVFRPTSYFLDLERNKKRKQYEDQEKKESEAKKLKKSSDSYEIYIAHFPERFRASDLKNLFGEYGIEIFNISFSTVWLAIAEVRSEEQFQKAIKALNYKEIEGKRLEVKKPPCGIYIADFPESFIESDLTYLFAEYGIKISNIRLKHKKKTTFAFVEVSSEEQIQKAIKALDLKMIRGRRLQVKKYKYSRIEDHRNQRQFEDYNEKMNSEAKKMKRCDPCDIFIADFPKYFIEIDLSNLFLEYGIDIYNIHLHKGIRPYAFAEVSSEEQSQKAIKALNHKKIEGGSLRVEKNLRFKPGEIYIADFPDRFSESDLRHLFEEFGIEISNIRFRSNLSHKFAFAEVSSENQVQKAIEALNSKMIRGSKLEVKKARRSQEFDVQEKMNSEPKKLKRRDPFEIYIAHFPERFSEYGLKNLFEEYEIEIFNIRFKRDQDRLFAFAEVSSEEQIQKAIEALNLRMIRGRRLSVKRAVRNKSKDFFSGKY